MAEFWQFVLLGLGSGAAYSLLGNGLVLIHRGSGTLNFAHGAMAMAGAYAFWDLTSNYGWGTTPAFIVSVMFVALIGVLMHLLVMRHLTRASGLSKTVATLGLLSLLIGIATLEFGGSNTTVDSFLTQSVWRFGGVILPVSQVVLAGIAVGVTLALYAAVRFTAVGLSVSAVAENQVAAANLGWSPDLLASLTWGVGGALAGAAGVLIAPLAGLDAENLTFVVIAAMAAALFGGFSSFAMTTVGAFAIGIAQSLCGNYVTNPDATGLNEALPFLAIMLVMFVRGKPLPVRGDVLQRLPRIGSGRVPWRLVGVLLVAVILVIIFGPQGLQSAIQVQLIAAILITSLVFLTGYAGQLSLAQYALAGVGAFIAGRFIVAFHVPMTVAFISGVVLAVPVGLIFALPAVRTRGVNLAVVTLGLGVSLQAMLFNVSQWTGGQFGLQVGPAHFLGLNLDPVAHPARYTLFCLFWFVLVGLVTANVRRGRVGRRLIAVRTNERAAASLGISITGAKLYAFGIASAMASVAGLLLGFSNYNIDFTQYDPISSINAVGDTFIGGMGYISGSFIGAGGSTGGITTYVLNEIGNLGAWLIIIGAVLLLVTLILNQDGVVGAIEDHRRARRDRRGHRPPELRFAAAPASNETLKGASVLDVRGVSVRFGGVTALCHASLAVRQGEVVGLIGPNGAGKTTLIDAVTGYVQCAEGQVLLDGQSLLAVPPFKRSRLGVCRSFQSLELFDDLTVLENLQTAADDRDQAAYVTSLVHPMNRPLPQLVADVIREFDLEDDIERLPRDMSHGRRRLVSIARAAAVGSRFLLLDEPAAGLDDRETGELGDLIRTLAELWNLGILVVEHHMGFVMSTCDRVVVLNFGSVLAEGPPDEIRRNPDVVAAYLGADPGGEEAARLPAMGGN